MENSLLNAAEDVATLYDKVQSGEGAQFSILELKRLTEYLRMLDQGEIRVAEKVGDKWVVNEWVKKIILCHMAVAKPAVMAGYTTPYIDHTKYKFSDGRFPLGCRIVPPSHIRYGAYIGQRVIAMPCFVNIGAYVDEGTMIDTFASIGSGAQIGRNVHVSAGSGIGGILEPLQAVPTIIENNCFIGARSEISEGVLVCQGAVIASGVMLSQSTKIYNRISKEITYGMVPENAVVVPGTLPSSDGTHSVSAAIIVKFADENTRKKTSINELLRF